jgi:hypothetical protein
MLCATGAKSSLYYFRNHAGIPSGIAFKCAAYNIQFTLGFMHIYLKIVYNYMKGGYE